MSQCRENPESTWLEDHSCTRPQWYSNSITRAAADAYQLRLGWVRSWLNASPKTNTVHKEFLINSHLHHSSPERRIKGLQQYICQKGACKRCKNQLDCSGKSDKESWSHHHWSYHEKELSLYTFQRANHSCLGALDHFFNCLTACSIMNQKNIAIGVAKYDRRLEMQIRLIALNQFYPFPCYASRLHSIYPLIWKLSREHSNEPVPIVDEDYSCKFLEHMDLIEIQVLFSRKERGTYVLQQCSESWLGNISHKDLRADTETRIVCHRQQPPNKTPILKYFGQSCSIFAIYPTNTHWRAFGYSQFKSSSFTVIDQTKVQHKWHCTNLREIWRPQRPYITLTDYLKLFVPATLQPASNNYIKAEVPAPTNDVWNYSLSAIYFLIIQKFCTGKYHARCKHP